MINRYITIRKMSYFYYEESIHENYGLLTNAKQKYGLLMLIFGIVIG